MAAEIAIYGGDEPETFLSVSVFLHAKPGQVFEEGEPVTAAQVRQYASDLSQWLRQIAGVLEKLEADEWELTMELYSVRADHANITTARQARARIRKLGLNVQDFTISEE